MYPGTHGLRNEYPAPITVGSTTYPTVEHAYWALSVSDPAARQLIADAAEPSEAVRLAEREPGRPGWPATRTAVMAGLLRAKFAQHPDLADVLIGTGDARIHYSGYGSTYWLVHGEQGRNWMGRLLELTRAELIAQRSGIPIP